jgi:hypothetical protein
MRLKPPWPRGAADPGAIKSLVVASLVPEDHVEHVYVLASPEGAVDALLFLSAADLSAAQVNGTALSTRLLRDCLPGWSLQRVWFETV